MFNHRTLFALAGVMSMWVDPSRLSWHILIVFRLLIAFPFFVRLFECRMHPACLEKSITWNEQKLPKITEIKLWLPLQPPSHDEHHKLQSKVVVASVYRCFNYFKHPPLPESQLADWHAIIDLLWKSKKKKFENHVDATRRHLTITLKNFIDHQLCANNNKHRKDDGSRRWFFDQLGKWH